MAHFQFLDPRAAIPYERGLPMAAPRPQISENIDTYLARFCRGGPERRNGRGPSVKMGRVMRAQNAELREEMRGIFDVCRIRSAISRCSTPRYEITFALFATKPKPMTTAGLSTRSDGCSNPLVCCRASAMATLAGARTGKLAGPGLWPLRVLRITRDNGSHILCYTESLVSLVGKSGRHEHGSACREWPRLRSCTGRNAMRSLFSMALPRGAGTVRNL